MEREKCRIPFMLQSSKFVQEGLQGTSLRLACQFVSLNISAVCYTSLNAMDFPLITPRLTLVILSLDYAENIFHEFTPQITKYMLPKSPTHIDETISYIKGELPKIERGEELPVVILHKETKEFLGGAGLHCIKTKTPRFGIWIKQSAQGHAYGREAIQALKHWADTHLTYDHLVYPVDKKNIPSRKIAESLGGSIKKEYTQANGSGNILDEVEYWIYRDM